MRHPADAALEDAGITEAEEYTDLADAGYFQLTHTGVVHDAPPGRPVITHYNDPRVRAFAVRQSDRLVNNYRSVYVCLCEFINQETRQGPVTAQAGAVSSWPEV